MVGCSQLYSLVGVTVKFEVDRAVEVECLLSFELYRSLRNLPGSMKMRSCMTENDVLHAISTT